MDVRPSIALVHGRSVRSWPGPDCFWLITRSSNLPMPTVGQNNRLATFRRRDDGPRPVLLVDRAPVPLQEP